ncbi:hypothetical protein [Virgibacillus halotolerans]|uniref:hypothetical protein n=1 Tax=Virgibacillus halotolerans TaxID=1071053 RepID=UPI00195FB24C|nr:hypothetical protein [Virgibacillus halotolerans]
MYVLYQRCPENDYAGEGIAWRANESYFGWIGEDQIEKVSDEITSATPKIGDKVIVVREIASSGEYAVGDVLTVEEVVGDSGIHVKDLGVGLLSSEFKVVEIAPDAPTFEVGEYAKFTRDEHEHSEGDVVLIMDDDGADSLPLRIEKVNGESYGYANRSALVTATDAEVAEAKQEFSPKFSVGDYAKVIGDTYHDDIDEGTIVKIVAGTDDDGDYEIQLLDKSDYDFAPASSLEKLSEKEAKFAKIGRKVDEYKVGDIVIVEVTVDHYGSPVGSIIELIDTRDDRDGIFKYRKESGSVRLVDYKYIELVTPVEHRFDK